MSDPLDLKGQAIKAGQAIRHWSETGEGEHELDQDWHVPDQLNEEGRQLMEKFSRSIENGDFRDRTPAERVELESARFNMFRLVLEHLFLKYKAASQALDLLGEIQEGKSGFVLLLWGFGSVTKYLDGATVVSVGLRSQLERDELAQKLSPTPLLWLANPVASAPMDELSAERRGYTFTPYRIESGRDWESNVVLLIKAASFIIVQNPDMTPGIVREIEHVRDAGRLSDTFFVSPENAQQVLPGVQLNPLTEENLERMRTQSIGRPVSRDALPEPTCLWIEGARRERMTATFGEHLGFLLTARKFRTPIPQDWLLDAWCYVLAFALVLDRFDYLPAVLEGMCDTLALYTPETFPHGDELKKVYGMYLRDFLAALEHTSPDEPLTVQVEKAIRYLRSETSRST